MDCSCSTLVQLQFQCNNAPTTSGGRVLAGVHSAPGDSRLRGQFTSWSRRRLLAPPGSTTHTRTLAHKPQVDKDLREMLVKPDAPKPRKVAVRVWPRAIPQVGAACPRGGRRAGGAAACCAQGLRLANRGAVQWSAAQFGGCWAACLPVRGRLSRHGPCCARARIAGRDASRPGWPSLHEGVAGGMPRPAGCLSCRPRRGVNAPLPSPPSPPSPEQFNIGHLETVAGAQEGIRKAGWDGVLLGGNYVAGEDQGGRRPASYGPRGAA